MPRGRLLVAAIAVSLAACHHGGDQVARARAGDADGAADELRYRLAEHPRDPDLLIALAEVEELRGRPGAALDALDRAALLGRPFRAGLGGDARARLAALLIARAEVRAARGSPDADADVRRARGLGAPVEAALARTAALAAIAGELRHSDPDRRDRGRARLRQIDAALAAGLDDGAAPDAIERTTAWLVEVGARRVAFEALDRVAERAEAAGHPAAWPAPTFERWLELRRWWSGLGDPIDRPTLDRAQAAGASTCAYADGPSDPGCDVVLAAASAPRWEFALFEAWERGGWRAPDRARAQAWAVLATRAVARGQVASWERTVRDHVEPAAFAALVRPADAPPDEPPDDAAPAGASAWPVLAAAVAGDPSLAEVAAGYARDPALADRRAEDAAARAVDVAVAGPALARLFRALGDPARARRWWQRAFDASPEDPAIALGLAVAMAEAGDPPAGLQLATRAAAGSGDASTTLYRAARGFVAAGQPLDALTLARQALELSAPGDEDAAAGLAAMLLRELGRDRAAAEVGALSTLPSAWDLTDLRAEVARITADAAIPERRAAARARALALAHAADPAAAGLGAATVRALARIALQ